MNTYTEPMTEDQEAAIRESSARIVKSLQIFLFGFVAVILIIVYSNGISVFTEQPTRAAFYSIIAFLLFWGIKRTKKAAEKDIAAYVVMVEEITLQKPSKSAIGKNGVEFVAISANDRPLVLKKEYFGRDLVAGDTILIKRGKHTKSVLSAQLKQ